MTLAAAVLAGGRSSRMGSTKALIEVDGRAMADRVLDAARSLGADPVVIVGGDPEELAALSAPVIPDRYPGEGPVAGVLAALQHFEGIADRVLALPCDLADVDATTLLPLIEAEAGDGFSRVWVAAAERLEPMCAIWSVDSIPRIQELFDAGERALHAVIGELPHVAVTVDAAGLTNINTPDELPG
jgi:molybdopterin-guanine dinucleotide biosynthesis protein A